MPPAPARRRKTILIAEDDREISDTLVDILTAAGYEVEVTADGHATVHRLETGAAPAAMILDLMMPGMNGWEVLKRVQGTPALQKTVVLVFSALPEPATPIPNVRWIRKPTAPDDLVLAVRAALQDF